ncbi:beta-phosphoglucomutase [Melissococcus plutonius]|uniref:Beta-phosphoglucomutase n=2 Tax=Melissococcus plutonius TaxID=33970 RepID=F3YCR3_MELPT|nr:beta-phosphoglucomutase [Melissococcus plutonius]BAL62876.1 beta-phosphoglucomutase [Melissococcus plutonius DAT561]AIM26053.1 beta-phosphoglucomutase PgmB [Melissococcus plutonius S1]KMT23611.1 beta-phosphoglucomutase PgmB [Melissococcus plutonius]KMT23664.1 beta-phosphoglucomutase PgmB [Melissococcus plutonius]KMT24298.1 beta-phosphoglucomutase PgmB [Melissococcus plutonius]
MLKGALFDLDGVIADTSVYHFDAWRKLVKDHFDKTLPDDLEEKTKGVSRGDSLQIILNYLHITVSKAKFDELATEKNNIYLTYLETLTPENTLPGIQEFIQTLKAHHIKLAVASASLNAPFILRKLDLHHAFDAIADPSAVKAGKPAPDIFLAAAAAIQLKPEECIGIEDSIAGITAINKAGSFSVGIGSIEKLHEANLLFAATDDLNLDTIVKQFNQQ